VEELAPEEVVEMREAFWRWAEERPDEGSAEGGRRTGRGGRRSRIWAVLVEVRRAREGGWEVGGAGKWMGTWSMASIVV
jgi:hypothetical protein